MPTAKIDETVLTLICEYTALLGRPDRIVIADADDEANLNKVELIVAWSMIIEDDQPILTLDVDDSLEARILISCNFPTNLFHSLVGIAVLNGAEWETMHLHNEEGGELDAAQVKEKIANMRAAVNHATHG